MRQWLCVLLSQVIQHFSEQLFPTQMTTVLYVVKSVIKLQVSNGASQREAKEGSDSVQCPRELKEPFK